jgi:hypothetical protein
MTVSRSFRTASESSACFAQICLRAKAGDHIGLL